MSFDQTHTPTGLNKVDEDHISITWADGKTCTYAMNQLRAHCPCAGCVDEWTHEVLVQFEDVQHVRVKKITPVGQYAFNITFDDGHNTGYFTFKKLRGLCENPAPPS